MNHDHVKAFGGRPNVWACYRPLAEVDHGSASLGALRSSFPGAKHVFGPYYVGITVLNGHVSREGLLGSVQDVLLCTKMPESGDSKPGVKNFLWL